MDPIEKAQKAITPLKIGYFLYTPTFDLRSKKNLYRLPPKSRMHSGVARAFLGGRLAHPEGQNEEENSKV